MKLLIENQKKTIMDGLTLNEVKSDSGTQLFIEGIFAQAEVLNGNKRIYPKAILEKAVNEYNDKFIKNGKSIGEFNHPDYPAPKWDNAAIMIKELKMDGNNVYGKALVLDTEKGKHLQALIRGGYNVGVSTRGLGNTKLSESGNTEVTQYMMTIRLHPMLMLNQFMKVLIGNKKMVHGSLKSLLMILLTNYVQL